MPANPIGVNDLAPIAGTVALADVIERPSNDANLRTTLTADPGSGGAALALTAAIGPAASGFKVRVEAETMLVTAGGTGTTPTVTRGVDGTTAVAHAIGSVAAVVVDVQRVEPVDGSREILFRGRVQSFRTPGRAGTAGHKILAIHNATGSPVKVKVNKIFVDFLETAVKAVTVVPPIIRAWKFTAVPTNGTALTKVPQDSAAAASSNAAVTVWGDASADGVASATALTVTLPAGLVYTQVYCPRLITAVGYELFDREILLPDDDDYIVCNALEGVALFADYTVATADVVASDFWIAGLEWEEYRVN